MSSTERQRRSRTAAPDLVARVREGLALRPPARDDGASLDAVDHVPRPSTATHREAHASEVTEATERPTSGGRHGSPTSLRRGVSALWILMMLPLPLEYASTSAKRASTAALSAS